MTDRGAEAGFTLIELLVSLAITSLAAALLGATLWTGRVTWGHAEAAAAGAESVAAAQSLIRDRVEHLFADVTDGVASNTVQVTGTPGSLAFLAAPIGAAGPGATRQYLLGLDRAGSLRLAAIDARASDTGPRGGWRLLPLVGNVSAIQFAYLGAAPDGGPPRWQANWTGRNELPSLVRLRLRFAPGDPRHWPDLLVAPRPNASTACNVDPVTGECR